MKNLFYGIAMLLIIAWGIGFIGYALSGVIHILLVLAMTVIIFGLSRTET